MEKEFVEQWLDDLKMSWQNKDIEKATALFKNTTFYQESPFLEPYTTFEEIEKEWQNIKNQNIKKIKFKVLAIDDKTVIVEWIFKMDISEFDGIYEIKFNSDKQCVFFRSWEVKK